ncbi:hypothetical protein AAFC00_001333 [Neodothiora populina]|uniref:Pyruvate dehydrogenase protein x component n=1 Tax=Neodothiora populina TaxID=2781224 RepID=A0ABR3PNJ6_9PEZI
MAAIFHSCKHAAALTGRHARRGFHVAAVNRAATSFTMPALSPTMTEGNIASWKLKEGDSFSVGDVILEIETDKAQMDVEAQDDGILAKITLGDGAKAIKVGERIGVLAEPGDDLSTLEIPAEEKASASEKPAQESKPAPKEEPKTPSSSSSEAATSSASSSSAAAPTKTQNKKYPLYPSVHALLVQNGLTKEDANSIPATGPQGRLLKGDVLEYLGKSEKGYAATLAKSIEKRGHLDLSNIQVAAPKKVEEKKAPKAAEAAEAAPVLDTEVALPVSLTAVIATQKRVQDTLGIYLPLSTFVARASELANEDLPLSKNRTPTSEELFNSVLGLDKVISKTSRGNYAPLITGFPSSPVSASSRSSRKTPDIIDILSGKSAAFKKAPAARTASAVGSVAPHSVFSVMAKTGEEKRVQEYLERMKAVLEAEPGRLVL